MKLKKKHRFTDLPEQKRTELTAFATKELTEFVLSRMATDLDAVYLYALANEFGFGKHRLRRAYDGVFEAKKELREKWLGNDKDVVEDAKRELRKIGVDIDLWDEQKRAWLDGGYKEDEVWNSTGHKNLKGVKK